MGGGGVSPAPRKQAGRPRPVAVVVPEPMADEFSDIRAAILTRINAVTCTTFSGVEISWPGQDASVDSVNVALHIAVEFSNRRRAALGAAAGSRIDGRAELTVLAGADAAAQPGTPEMGGYAA